MALPSTSWTGESPADSSWNDEAKPGQFVILVDEDNDMIDTEDGFFLITEGEDSTSWSDESLASTVFTDE